MALIPPDAGIRMRMQAEANLLQPVAPAHEIPSDLPDLQPGQAFSARIQEVLPDNTYKALVAGKQLTLQLPEGAKAGDELELVVVDRTVRGLVAKQAELPQKAGGESVAYEFAKFSPAARLISQLLPAEGKNPPSAPLNRGQPILAQPPQSQSVAQQLAPALARSVSESGLFYEAHQAQWVTGKIPLGQILLEPQGQHSAPAAYDHAVAEIASRLNTPVAHPSSSETGEAVLSGQAPKVGAGETVNPASSQSTANTATSGNAGSVPEELRPLVQQQLEAAATNRLFWHGEVWPHQTLEWEIEWDGRDNSDNPENEDSRWKTSLSLTTPRLGQVDAHLQLSESGVRIALATPDGASAADLRDAAPELAEALATAGVPLIAFAVKHEDVASNQVSNE